MVSNAPPSKNTANNGSLAGLFQLVLRKHLQNSVDDMLPARVLAYDRATNRAQVEPLISMVTTLNEIVQRAQIASVPVLQLGGGDFVISFPLKTGDLGWIKANDRDISLFKKTFTSNPPNTQRFHSFEDALLIPDTMLNGFTIADEDTDHALFQNKDASVRIALWPHQVKVTTPNMGIGDVDGFALSPHALLDLVSTTKAFRPPTMSTAQKEAIPSPQIGYTVYDTDELALSTYNGAAWS